MIKRVEAMLVLPLMALVVACGDDGQPKDPEPEPSDAKVELGTGEAEFEPIEGEPTLKLNAGFQGGFHIWASMMAWGFEEDEIEMVLTTELDGEPDSLLSMKHTRASGGNPLQFKQVTDEEGELAHTFAGYPAQVLDARCAHGKRVHLRVTLTDTFGNEASDERYCYASLAEEYRDDTCP